jgi:hypothetical protein
MTKHEHNMSLVPNDYRKNPRLVQRSMSQKMRSFSLIVLCKTTIRADDHGLDRPISPNPYMMAFLSDNFQ